MKNLYKAKNLLNETLESFYWLGFIMADGHINDRQLSVTLQEKDEEQLKNLAKFLMIDNKMYVIKLIRGFKTEQPQISLVVSDSFNLPIYKELYGLKNNKTYNPPNLPVGLSKEQFISLLIGYIDGDGCIYNLTGVAKRYVSKKTGKLIEYERNDFNIQIKCHSAWFDFLCQLEVELYKHLGKELSKSKVSINKEGYAFWRIQDNKVIREIKKELQNLGIPCMARKWNKISV